MRYTQSLDDLLGSPAQVRILRYLCTAGGEHSGREIARNIAMGETPVHRALQKLTDTLIVVYRVAGRTHHYRLNEHHVLVTQVLRPLFAAEGSQRDAAIADLLADLDVPLEAAVVYGSVARGEDSWRSDLDVLLVTPTAADARRATERAWQRDGDLLERYGLISVRALSRNEVADGIRRNEPWLVAALHDGIVVKGALTPHLLRPVSDRAVTLCPEQRGTL